MGKGKSKKKRRKARWRKTEYVLRNVLMVLEILVALCTIVQIIIMIAR